MTTPLPVPVDKEALRRIFKAFRARLSPSDYRQRSAAIVEQASRLPALQHAQVVHAYWPLVKQHEVDIRPLLRDLQAQGKQIVLPVVETFSKDRTGSPRLRHTLLGQEADLLPNRWGIHEPTGGPSVPLDAWDAILVPALGAGRNGHRIGHGFGYYDELLSELSIPVICPVFSACLLETVPAESHDVPVTLIITEEEIFHPTPSVTSTPGPRRESQQTADEDTAPGT